MKTKLRGVEVEIDDKNQVLRLVINKPVGRSYSVSDRVMAYVDKGYVAEVDVNGELVKLTKDTPHYNIETVKSKFPKAGPWKRYWFSLGRRK